MFRPKVSMLTIPTDLVRSAEFSCLEFKHASLVNYAVDSGLQAESVFVKELTIVLIRKGLKQFTTASSAKTQLASEGMLLAFRSGVHVMSEFGTDGGSYESLVVSFNRAFLKEVIGLSDELLPEGPKALSVSLSRDVWERLVAIPDQVSSSDSETEREFRFREFLVLAMGHPEVRKLLYQEVAVWGDTIEERISTVMRLHGLTPLRIEDLATLCGMSLASFKRHFRSIYESSPGTWLREMRLRHARSLVLNSVLSVGEICEACGYQDVSGFTRAFTKKFGASPMSVRVQSLCQTSPTQSANQRSVI